MASLILRRSRGVSVQVSDILGRQKDAKRGNCYDFYLMRTCLFQRWYSAAALPLTKPVETNTPAEGSRADPEEVKVIY